MRAACLGLSCRERGGDNVGSQAQLSGVEKYARDRGSGLDKVIEKAINDTEGAIRMPTGSKEALYYTALETGVSL